MDPKNHEYLMSPAIRVECESLATDAIRMSVIEGSGHVCPGKLNRPPLPSGEAGCEISGEGGTSAGLNCDCETFGESGMSAG